MFQDQEPQINTYLVFRTKTTKSTIYIFQDESCKLTDIYIFQDQELLINTKLYISEPYH